MTLLKKIRASFTTQLALWVAGIVALTSGTVIALLTSFSEETIREETIDTTQQALENLALRVDNTMRQMEMTARLEQKRLRANRSRIENIVDENGSLATVRKSLPNAQLFVTRRDSSQLDSYLTGGGRSYLKMEHNGQEKYIFSQPIGDRHFCLAVVCPAEDIYERYARMHRLVLLWGTGCVLVLIYLLFLVIARQLRPLHILADTAQRIADGDLETPIADSHQIHETGRLQTGLKKMQTALRRYMDEMQQKRTTLSTQNAELQEAYGEAEAYERKRMRFLQKMTGRMEGPVADICRNTDTICRDYPTLSRQDMDRLEADIARDTERITQLLDQFIKEPAGL